MSDGALQPVSGFEAAPGREDWYTPWGGAPSTRSLSVGAEGELYANVHVGGIPTSVDGGATWTPTVEIHADVHEVRAIRSLPGLLLAATARGFAASPDFGESWEFVTDGLAATYSRAIALAGETVVMTASDGPRGGHAAVYRRPLDATSEEPFERCREGLPEWFDRNIDTGCLDASGETVAFATASGSLYLSTDSGASWELASDGLPPVRCLLLLRT